MFNLAIFVYMMVTVNVLCNQKHKYWFISKAACLKCASLTMDKLNIYFSYWYDWTFHLSSLYVVEDANFAKLQPPKRRRTVMFHLYTLKMYTFYHRKTWIFENRFLACYTLFIFSASVKHEDAKYMYTHSDTLFWPWVDQSSLNFSFT